MHSNVYHREHINEKQNIKINVNTVYAHIDTNINFQEILREKTRRNTIRN
jgi:hypothetical protein